MISDFTIEGNIFNCCEQWMMYNKAFLFGDKDKAKQILEEKRPNVQRKLGRQVRFFKEEKWLQYRYRIVFQGNYAKFTQNDKLKVYLLNTGNKKLAESSPTDLIWGIGLPEDSPYKFDESKWRGENLLGEVLMKVRECIRTGYQPFK
ncbi:NADAR family protein [Cytophagaceae bacterium ABcell3]|nr:NADAR family protein [Cytophagaceae bacterium ABcell3]